MTLRFLLAIATLVAGCSRGGAPGTAQTASDARNSGAVQQGRALLEQGQLDAALAKLEKDQGPDGLYYQGLVWAKKAEAVPAIDDQLKLEDQRALALLEKAAAAKADHALAHLAIADLLAPYTYRRYRPQAARRSSKAPPPPVPGEPDLSPERVMREYKAALALDPKATAPARGLIRIARGLQRLDDADAAFRELVTREKESSEPHVSYGDFLLDEKKDRMRAVEQYSLALVWKPDDVATKTKIADIYLAMGEESFARKEYATAQARFQDVQKSATDPASPQVVKAKGYLAKLEAMRARY